MNQESKSSTTAGKGRVYFRASATPNEGDVIHQLRSMVPRRGLSPAEGRLIAERQANVILASNGLERPPVSETVLSEIRGLEVLYRVNWPTSGMTKLVGDTWAILIRSNEPKVRQRFTIAHEFKHVLDDPAIEWIYPTVGSATPEDRAEAACDYFAACLLMPKVWLRRDWTEGRQNIARLAQRYNVSTRAMEVRLTQLGLLLPRPRCAGTTREGAVE